MSTAYFYLQLLDNITTESKAYLTSDNTISNENMKFSYSFDRIYTQEDIYTKLPVVKHTLDLINNRNATNLSYCFIVFGPEKSGKSNLMRGSNDMMPTLSDGMMLSLIKEYYKLFITLMNNKDDILLLKLGILGLQDNSCISLTGIDEKSKHFFDEIILSEDKTYKIKYVSSFDHIYTLIANALSNRNKMIAKVKDHLILYQFFFQIKSNKLEKKFNLQLDFYEVNSKANEAKDQIMDLLTNQTKNDFIHNIIYKSSPCYQDIYFFLCLNNKLQTIQNELEYLKVNTQFQTIFNRKDLVSNIKEIVGCVGCGEAPLSKIEYTKILNEILNLNKEAEEIYSKVKKVKCDKTKLVKGRSDGRNFQTTKFETQKLMKVQQDLDGIRKRMKHNTVSMRSCGCTLQQKGKTISSNSLTSNFKDNKSKIN